MYLFLCIFIIGLEVDDDWKSTYAHPVQAEDYVDGMTYICISIDLYLHVYQPTFTYLLTYIYVYIDLHLHIY